MKEKMFFKNGVLLLCVLTIASHQAALADTEDRSEEVGTSQEIKSSSHNESSSAEMGFPDSHEAMNNREISLRNKRSYEFLMGLINNNSKYEVTRAEPPSKILRRSEGEDPNATASEILLELMVRIAAHPDHWNKVHHLLENIDNDLIKSKKLVEDLQNAKIKTPPTISVDKKEGGIFKNKSDHHLINNEWPTFQDEVEMSNKVNKVAFVNTASPESYHIANDQHKNSYPKTFAYHRVTGRPMFLNKNPKAYIAVSVIAPKPMMSRSKDEDLILEKELRQLKPWTHSQNLKNMASIRSRWVIQRDEGKDSVAP